MSETESFVIAPPSLLRSFWMAGFESACHVNRAGERVDMIAGIQHDRKAREDYQLLPTVNMRCARDGVRWHLIDRGNGCYDFSSFLPMLRASIDAGIEVVWNLCHYGWPDGLDLFSPEFVKRFASFASAVATLVKENSADPPFYTPVNEISFFSWAGSRFMYPFAEGRDNEIKRQLVRATLAACDAIRTVDPRARFVYPEPVIHVVAPEGRPDLAADAKGYNESQYEVWDMIAGHKNPELGGAQNYLDIIGLNYYHSNQWEHPAGRLRWEDEPRDPRWVPFHQLVLRNWHRYERPIVITETSHFGSGRARWIREMANEVYQARLNGVQIEGVCLYPILDRYDWDDRQHWHNSGLWDMSSPADPTLRRVINSEYAQALNEAQQLLSSIGCR